MVGLCILVLSSAAFADNQYLALVALIVAMLFIAVGTGGIKSNTGPWAAEQYTKRDTRKPEILETSERVVVDYDRTIQRQLDTVHISVFLLC